MKANQAKVEIITPSLAANWLKKNSKNRALTGNNVIGLVNAIKRNEWKLNGESIKFDKNGRLLDGQHRLEAVRQSGIAIQSLVIRGLPSDVFATLDTGRPRQASDLFSIQGETNTRMLSTALIRLFSYERDKLKSVSGGRVVTATTTQLQKLLKQNSSIRESCTTITGKKWCRRYLNPGNAAFCHYVFMKNDLVACMNFFNKLETGEDLSGKSPILTLRERLMFFTHNTQLKLNKRTKLALIFKSFKAYRDNKPMSKIGIRANEDIDKVFDLTVGV